MIQQQVDFVLVAVKAAAVLAGVDTDAFHEVTTMMGMALQPRACDDAAPAKLALPARPASQEFWSQRNAGPQPRGGRLEPASCQSRLGGWSNGADYDGVDENDSMHHKVNDVSTMTTADHDFEENLGGRAQPPHVCAQRRDAATSTDDEADGNSGRKTGDAGGNRNTTGSQTNASEFDLQRCEHDARFAEWLIDSMGETIREYEHGTAWLWEQVEESRKAAADAENNRAADAKQHFDDD